MPVSHFTYSTGSKCCPIQPTLQLSGPLFLLLDLECTQQVGHRNARVLLKTIESAFLSCHRRQWVVYCRCIVFSSFYFDLVVAMGFLFSVFTNSRCFSWFSWLDFRVSFLLTRQIAPSVWHYYLVCSSPELIREAWILVGTNCLRKVLLERLKV